MLSTQFKTAWRNMVRHKAYATINITGLAMGIAVCTMIFLIIQYHNSFDDFHAKKDRTYRLLTEYHHPDTKKVFTGKGVPAGFPDAIKNSFPEIEQVAPLYKTSNNQFVILNQHNEVTGKFKEEQGLFYTTPAFFKIFDFPLLVGSYESLKDPNKVLLTQEIADRYFGDWRKAMDQSIRINNNDVMKVAGILAPMPPNTDFKFKLVASFGTEDSRRYVNSTDYNNTNGSFGCYVLLNEQASADRLNRQIRDFSKKMKEPNNKDEQLIEPLKDVHYNTAVGSFGGQQISPTLVNILWIIAAFILLIACVNFINLSTAQAVNRAKEVGVRKVLGSNRWKLRWQFLAETSLIVSFSILVALAFIKLGMPYINNLLQLSLSINATNMVTVLLFLAGTLIAVVLLAGFYPAVVLSKFNPILALKSKLTLSNTKGLSLRRGLVVFQFVIAQALIIGTLVIVKQMIYFTSQPLGFDKEAVVIAPLPTDSTSNTKLAFLQQQLQDVSGVKTASFSSNTPIEDNNDDWTTITFDNQTDRTPFYSILKYADNNFANVYDLPLIAGKNIDPSDTARQCLVNELVLKNLDITRPEDALNKEIRNGVMKATITGVLKDFQTRSFRSGMAPLIITTKRTAYNQAAIKLTSANMVQAMSTIEKIWNKDFPEFVFEYKFLDEKVASFYKQERQLSQLYKLFATIAIFLSCLGLYGLASFMAVQRIKEVGIRKVLGATSAHILYLFSREFIVLITIAFAIASPLAWYFMNEWLRHFAYRIDISWWIFLAGGLASLVIALLTVGFQATKAAITNPVKNLRTE